MSFALLLFGPNAPDDIVTLCWVVFILFWIYSAFGTKQYVRRGSWGIGIRIVIALLLVLLLQSQTVRDVLKNWQLAANPAVQWLGAVLAVCGVSFAIWARVHLGRNWGMPMSLKKDPELVTTGPYRYVRHPIYSGMILTMLGTTLVVIWWVVPLVFFFGYFVWAARTEERIMSKEFPDTYPDYMKRSKMLVPFVF